MKMYQKDSSKCQRIQLGNCSQQKREEEVGHNRVCFIARWGHTISLTYVPTKKAEEGWQTLEGWDRGGKGPWDRDLKFK